MKQRNNGFSLIEVLVFLTILSLVFIAGATVATVSIKNSITAENKSLATRYAEELKEWLQGQKEADWQKFNSNVTGATYCFNIDPILVWGSSVGTCQNIVDNGKQTIFQRQVALSAPSANQAKVSITVKWNEAGNGFTIPLNTIFAPFE